ncbi:MAG: RDD family protein [Verrucomicrobiales bacterium]|nr:RDD family protein [Verrucomicrobiales bacterium]
MKARWIRGGWLAAVLLGGAVSQGLGQTPLQAERDESETPPPRQEPPARHHVGEVLGIFSSSELPANQRAHNAVTVFGDSRIEGEVRNESVTVFGNAVVRGRIGGECVTVFGDLDLDSVVDGEVVVIMGDARFGPNAVVHGECIVVGGRITAEPGATFHRQKREIAGFLPSVGGWFRYGLFWGRPVVPSLGWVWVVVALHFVVYFLVALLLPKPVEACERVLQEQGLAAFGVGLLGIFLFWPVVFVVGVTVAGLVVIPFLLVAAVGAVLLGKTATFQWLGRTLLRRLGADGPGGALTGFLVGFLLITLVYLVPVLGLVAWGVLVPLGFGAALMALVQVIRESRPPRPARPLVMPVPSRAVAATVGIPTSSVGAAGLADVGSGGPSLTASTPVGETGLSLDAPAAGAGTGAETPPLGPASPLLSTAPATPLMLSPGELAVMPRAGFWIRLAATLLDLVLLAWFARLVHGYFPLLWLAYHVGMWMWKGTTIGGIVCSLKVVREDGRPLDFTVALVRALAAVFSFVALGLGFFWAGWSPERQSWHDKIAGTVIVKVPKGVSLI